MPNYRKQYINIYLWKIVSILLGFASLFVVVPYLSPNKILYGTYSVCTSLTIFFSYADLGFLSSGAKYAAEYYIKGDYKNEVKVMGFTAFLMMIIFLLIDIVFVVLAITPELLIPELQKGTEQYHIAQMLLALLAGGCPLIILQRVLQIVFMIRVEDYKYQRITIIGSLLRILSVLYFFRDGNYRIVEYYTFYQVVNLLVVIACLLSTRKYGYKIKDLISAFRFDRKIFNDEKSLSFASFLFMISMMLYNEFDQIAISNLYGVEAVALYATAFSIMTFTRTYSGLVYAPFTSRYNHFTGLGNYQGLVDFTGKVIVILGPILVLPLLNVGLYAKPFIISWVGTNYADAYSLVFWMVMSYAVNFITQPLSCYMTATEQNKRIVLGAILLPPVYWVGILLLSQICGLKSFAIMKFLAVAVLVPYYWSVVSNNIRNRSLKFINLKKVVFTLLPPIFISIILSLFLLRIAGYDQSKTSLFVNISIIAIGTIVSLLISLICNVQLRQMTYSYMKSIYHSTSVQRKNN